MRMVCWTRYTKLLQPCPRAYGTHQIHVFQDIDGEASQGSGDESDLSDMKPCLGGGSYMSGMGSMSPTGGMSSSGMVTHARKIV